MRPAAFSFAPQFSTRGAGVVAFDKVRITLSRSGGVAFDTIVAFPSDSDSIRLVLTAPINGASETMSLTLALINAAGDTVFRGGPLPVTLVSGGGSTGGGGVTVPVRYVGIGANAKSVVITPLTASLFFRDSVTLGAAALDSSGVPIPGTPIAWRSLDTTVAKVRADTMGRVIAGLTRGVARIEASLPTGQADTAQVAVQPLPAALGIVSGDAQSAAVGTALAQPLVVKVKGADSLPVQGVVITWAVTAGGGSLTKTTDTTDATGNVSTSWTLGTALGAQSVKATVASAPTVTATLSATAVAGAPKKLAFQVQPSTVASGVAMVPAVQVVAQDSFGNTATTFTGNVTVAIGTNPGSSTLGGTTTVAAVAGVATFSTLTLNIAGTGYTLVAGSTGLTGATSGAFNVTAGVPAQLAFAQQPSNATAGAAISPAVTVQVRDASGNLVTTATTSVTVAIGTNPGGGTLSGTATASAVAGVASFAGLSVDKAGIGYTLAASASGLTGATSSAFTIAAGAASKLVITTQPSTTAQSGLPLAQQPVLQLQDALGNAVSQSGTVVTAAIASGGGTLGGTATATTNAGGTATFANLSITGTVGARTLSFAATGLTGATSGTITLTAGTATQLALTTQPSSAAQSGVAFAQQPVLQVQDASGNAVSQSGVVVTAAIASGGGTLGGTLTATTSAGGAATFTNLSITGTAGARTLSFTASGLTSATSGTITLTAGAASQLVITTQPSAAAQSGVPFAQQPVIQLQDASGNAVSQSGVVVTAAIASGGGTLGGTLTATTNAGGTATFTNLSITGTVGARTLSFTATGLTGATSGTITLSAGAASQLAITTQPSAAAQSGIVFSPQPVIQIQDAAGNAVSQSGVVVTAAIASGGGTLGGTLTATTSAAGAAAFTNLSITGTAGARTLSFTATGLTSVTSGTIVVGAGAPTQLAITTQPSSSAQSGVAFAQQPVIQLQDASGNAVSQSGVVVTAAIASGGGTLGGTLTATTNAGGAATFTGLSITGTVGARTLSFAASGLTGATSGTITLTAGAASQLVITTQPSASAASGVAFAQQPVIQLQDASGNAVSQSGVVVTAAIASGGGTLGGTTTATTSAAGTATFTNLSITGTVGARTLSFTATGLTGATSGTITLTAGAASQLVITTQPSATAASGTAFAQQPVIQLQDGSGNAVSQSGVVVTAAIASGGGTLGGTTTATTNAGGTATFTNLSITGLVGTRTLSFSATGLTGATSSSINITVGAAIQLAITTEPPASVASLAAFGLAVTARDGGGNTVSTFTGSVTVAIGTNPAGGTLSGTLTVNASAGVATFSGLTIDNIGTGYTLTATATGLTSATTTAFNITAPLGVNAWINAAGGNWNTAANWSKGAVPVPTDTVTITQSGTYTVNLDVSATVAKLTAGAPSGTQTLSVGANTLSVGAGNGTFAANTVLDLSGTGTITGAGTLTLSGPFNWTGGNLGGTTGAGGTIRVLAGVTTTISPAANVSLQGYTLEMDGPSSWTGTAFINSGSGGTLRVGSGGVLTVSGDPTISYNLGGASSLFTNLGTVNRTTSGNSFVVNAPVSGTGAWNVLTGSINLQFGGTVSGPVSVSSGATLNLFTTAAALTFDATSSLSGAGAVNFGNGTTTIAGSYGVTGSTFISGGTANFNAASSTAGPLTLSAGNLSGTGLLTVNGPMNWTGGNLGATSGAGGTTHVAASTSLAINPTAGVSIQGYTLEVAGAGSWSGTQTVSSGSGAILRVASGGTLDLRGNPTFAYTLGGATPVLNVLGTVTRSSSNGPTTIAVPFNDSGTVSISSGTLLLSGGGASTGSFATTAGDSLVFGGGTHTLAAGSSITGTGTLAFTGGTASMAGAYSVSGPTAVAGGTANFDGPGDSATAVTLSSGTLGGSGILSIVSSFGWTGGTLGGPGLTTKVLASATWTMAPAAAVTFVADTLELSGTGTWTGTQTVNSGSGAILRVMPGGVLTIQGDPLFAYTQGGALPLLDNQGTINRTTSANAVTLGVPFNQAGTLNIQSGFVNVANGGTMSGPVSASPGTVLLFSNGSVSLANRFAVTGSSALTEITGGTLGGLTATDTASFDNLTLAGGAVSLSGGTITTPFELIWSGPTAVSGGTLFVPGSAGVTMAFTTGTPSLQNATLLIQGSGGWTGTTPLSSGSGAVIRIQGANANLSLSGAGGGFLYNLGGAPSLLDNQGTLIAAPSAGSPGAFTISAQVNNSGSGGIDVTLDTLRLSGGFSGTFPGPISVVSGATLELGGGTFTLASPLNLGGNLLVSGGVLQLNGKPSGVAGNFATSGSGALQMQSAADSLGIGGSASFGGGTTTGFLTAGLIDLKGNFAQSGNASSFAPSTAQRTRFDNGAGALQTISFANPTQSFFDSLIVDRFTPGIVELLTDARVNRGFLIQDASSLTGPTARLTIIGGTLQTILSTSSPQVTPLVIEMQAAPLAGGAPALISPDTMVYDGTVATLPTGSGIKYKSLRVNTSGSFRSPGGVTYNGDLIVSSGTYTMNTGTDSVGGFLRTEGTGALSMQIANAPNLAVRDSAVFAGGPSNNMVIGTLRVGGDFVERGTSGQFAPTGTTVVMRRSAAGAQAIQFADSVSSFFHDLDFAGNVADTIRLLSNVQVQDSAVMSGTSVLQSNATEALKVLSTGVLRVHSQAALFPFRAEAGTWVLDSTFIGGNAVRIAPDTAVILNGSTFSQGSTGAISSSPTPVMGWKSVRLAGGTLVSNGTTYNGALVVSGGTYAPNTFGVTDSVKAFFRTEGTGVLQMATGTAPATMIVADSAVFAGGDETGQLPSGIMKIGGDFVQRGLSTSYTADGGHSTIFDGTSAAGQQITFGSPGITASHFGFVQDSNTAGPLKLNSNVFVNNSFTNPSTGGGQVSGSAATVLTTQSIYLLGKFTFTGAPVAVLDTAIETAFTMDTVTFSGYDPTVDQLTVVMTTARTATTIGDVFTSAPTTGHYLHVAWNFGLPGTNPVLTMTGATPAAQGGTSTVLADGTVGIPIISW